MKEIICRLFVQTESGFSEFADISEEERNAFADECVRRIGEALNEKSVHELLRKTSAVPC